MLLIYVLTGVRPPDALVLAARNINLSECLHGSVTDRTAAFVLLLPEMTNATQKELQSKYSSLVLLSHDALGSEDFKKTDF